MAYTASKKHVNARKTKSGRVIYYPSMKYLMSLGDTGGHCFSCAESTDGVEPDAEYYTCPHCGEPTVFGREFIVMMGAAY